MTIRSQKQLGKHVGVTETTVRRWIVRDDWPVKRRAPWSDKDLAIIEEWRKGLQEDRATEPAVGVPGGPNIKSQVQTILTKLKADYQKLVNEKFAGALVDRGLLDRAMGGLARMFVQVLDELQQSLPLRLAGLEAARIEAELDDVFRDCRRRVIDQAKIELAELDDLVDRANEAKTRGRPQAGGRR